MRGIESMPRNTNNEVVELVARGWERHTIVIWAPCDLEATETGTNVARQ